VAVLLFVVPVGAWVLARWRLDRWQFLERLFNYDFVARTLTTIEGHPGTPLYYLHILAKHHYDWLLAALIAVVLFPVPWPQVQRLVRFWRSSDRLTIVLTSWALATLLIPTVMATKLPWYLNAFYPVFALGVAWILAHALSMTSRIPGGRGTFLAVSIVAAGAFAEAKLLWYSFHHRDLRRSVQGLLLEEKDRLRGHRVFRRDWDYGEIFILGGLVGAEWRPSGLEHFRRDGRPGDCFVSSRSMDVEDPAIVLIRTHARHSLYCRRE
jgi:4-amino-4-deoxy-L-arabinose transferase-like glycosyltransferase